MKKFFKRLLTLLSTLILLILIIISIYSLYIINQSPSLDLNKLLVKNNCLIYDRDGNEISNQKIKQTYITIDQINHHMVDAIISIEDTNFYSHQGININRILGATLNNLRNRSYSQGASTITQQLIKNVYLSQEKKLKRKLTEINLALELEKKYTKNQILEAYLNNILFGGNIYGIEEASLYYYNKPALYLNINEAATLAGIIQLPNLYNPYINYDLAIKRRNLVLKRMLDNHKITNQEYEKNINQRINLDTNIKGCNKQNYNSFLDYTNQYLADNYNMNLYNDSLKIKTTLDKNIQDDINKIMTNEYGHFSDDALKCAIVMINNKGEILGIGGNRSQDAKVLNYANKLIQPGSTIKPILDYAPALEYYALSPASIINDEPYSYSNGISIKNWDYQFKGNITLKKALSESRNVPALKLYQMVGEEKALAFAKRLNIKPIGNVYESEALGGSTYGYTLINLTNAYLAFMNNGYYIEATPIKRINNIDINNKYQKVMKESTAFFINYMLHDVFKNSSFDLTNAYLMAKTGQTNFDQHTRDKYNIPINSTKDSLVIAYTSDLALGIWVSYNDNSNYLIGDNLQLPRRIMKELLSKHSRGMKYLSVPNNISMHHVSEKNGNLYLSKNEGFYEYFIDGTEPKSYFSSQKKI